MTTSPSERKCALQASKLKQCWSVVGVETSSMHLYAEVSTVAIWESIPQFKATAKLGEFLEGRFSKSF